VILNLTELLILPRKKGKVCLIFYRKNYDDDSVIIKKEIFESGMDLYQISMVNGLVKDRFI